MGPPTSDVWKFFEKLDDDNVKCTLCSKEYPQRNGNTSNMRKHLMNTHRKLVAESTASARAHVLSDETRRDSITRTASKMMKFKAPSESDSVSIVYFLFSVELVMSCSCRWCITTTTS